MPELTDAEKERFSKIGKELNALLADIKQRVPEAKYYATPSLIHIISEDQGDKQSPDTILDEIFIHHLDAGDW